MYSKTRSLKELYEKINNYYLINNNSLALNEEIKNEASKKKYKDLEVDFMKNQQKVMKKFGA